MIAVYIGAGIDIIPILLFRHIQTFIYIDSESDYIDKNYRTKFFWNFHDTISSIGYIKIPNIDNTNLHTYKHYSRNTEVLYFMNTNFPTGLTELVKDYISRASTLICCGHNPNKVILDLMKPGPKIFIGNNQTVYLPDEKDDVCNSIYKNNNLIKEFIRFDIPDNYPYWKSLYVEDVHMKDFRITTYNSLESLYRCKNKCYIKNLLLNNLYDRTTG